MSFRKAWRTVIDYLSINNEEKNTMDKKVHIEDMSTESIEKYLERRKEQEKNTFDPEEVHVKVYGNHVSVKYGYGTANNLLRIDEHGVERLMGVSDDIPIETESADQIKLRGE